jgi:catechol-2,3-dioxygenase
MLAPENKETRRALAGDQIIMADQDVDFNNIITGDETWWFCTIHSINIGHVSINPNSLLGNENSN